MIESFTGQHRWLSNFWPCRIVLDGKVYDSIEHAFQASKTRIEEERRDVRLAGSPGEAKRLGRRVTLREDWEEIKLPMMAELVLQKFSKHADLKEKLLATGDEEIVEGNSWRDSFWGVYKGSGKNHLGEIIMRVREQLRRC